MRCHCLFYDKRSQIATRAYLESGLGEKNTYIYINRLRRGCCMKNENSSLFFPKLDFTHAKYVATKGFIE